MLDAPSFVATLPPAIAHLLAHGVLGRFEMSVFRSLGAGVDVRAEFARLRQEVLDRVVSRAAEEGGVAVLAPSSLASLAATLQAWVPFLRHGAGPHEQQEVVEERSMWSRWLVEAARKLTKREVLDHRVQRSKSGLARVGKEGSRVRGIYTSVFAICCSAHICTIVRISRTSLPKLFVRLSREIWPGSSFSW